MRRLLGSVLPTLVVVTVLVSGLVSGCGDDEGGTATDESTTTAPLPSDEPTSDQGGEVDFQLVDTITETAAGGTVSEVAVPLGDQTAVQEFTAEFETDALTTRVQDAVARTDVPDGMLLYGAVVAVGCDSPTEVSVVAGDTGLVITADKVKSPKQECFAPMTTVALVLVPASAVG